MGTNVQVPLWWMTVHDIVPLCNAHTTEGKIYMMSFAVGIRYGFDPKNLTNVILIAETIAYRAKNRLHFLDHKSRNEVQIVTVENCLFLFSVFWQSQKRGPDFYLDTVQIKIRKFNFQIR
jgi:hypothetical protein